MSYWPLAGALKRTIGLSAFAPPSSSQYQFPSGPLTTSVVSGALEMKPEQDWLIVAALISPPERTATICRSGVKPLARLTVPKLGSAS